MNRPAAIYARVSSDRQKENHTIMSQIAALKEYARLDSANEQLWRGRREIHLRPKTFEVLRYLLEHPAQLVTKAALLDAVWPRVIVSDAMPGICVAELRKCLGDERGAPRFIETIHGRGYRFIAQITNTATNSFTLNASPALGAQVVIGREAELEQLRRWFGQVLKGQRRSYSSQASLGSVRRQSSEPSSIPIGQESSVRIGCGQCIEQYGSAEPRAQLKIKDQKPNP
jgi:DNA-binding winged helix-turn-helix (wHTH) protein